MGCKIDGFRQGVRYGSSKEHLWFRLKLDGEDVISPDSTPTAQFHDQSGIAIGSAVDLVRDASSGWWYYDLDASGTGTWEKGYGYRAELAFIVSEITHYDHIWLDVVMWPFNEPLVSSEELGEEYPAWAASMPAGWSDWTKAILAAHLELAKDLRGLRDNRGVLVYPHRILDRGQLRLVELAYVEEHVVTKVIISTDDERTAARAKKGGAYRRLGTIWIDRDDDLVVDTDEEASLGITFEH